jgi:predicted DNA-binding helix-hairpin-helix protein
MKVTINGEAKEVTRTTLTYDQIADLAFGEDRIKIKGLFYSVVYTRMFRNGTVTPGQKIRVSEGMRITIMYTGNA